MDNIKFDDEQNTIFFILTEKDVALTKPFDSKRDTIDSFLAVDPVEARYVSVTSEVGTRVIEFCAARLLQNHSIRYRVANPLDRKHEDTPTYTFIESFFSGKPPRDGSNKNIRVSQFFYPKTEEILNAGAIAENVIHYVFKMSVFQGSNGEPVLFFPKALEHPTALYFDKNSVLTEKKIK